MNTREHPIHSVFGAMAIAIGLVTFISALWAHDEMSAVLAGLLTMSGVLHLRCFVVLVNK